MNTTFARWLAVVLVTGPITTHANMTISTDTATDLVGTFSVSGTAVESATPAAFDFGLSYCMPMRTSRSTTATIGVQCAGTPDDPRASLQNVLAGAQSSGSVSGKTTALAGSTVQTFYFRYSNLHDTGGSGGTFSGAFCFSRSSTGCGSIEPTPIPATLGGFFPPVDSPSVATNEARAGQAIPLKFYAATSRGPITNLSTAHLDITGVACTDVSTAAQMVEEYSTGATPRLENLGGGYYQYNWKTAKTDAGTCKRVTLSLPAPYTTTTKPVADFHFRHR